MSDFKGIDFAELADHWGIETDESKLLADYIIESLYTTYDDNYSGREVLDSAVKGAMLEFLDAFIKKSVKHNYGTAIFIGLRMLADDDDSMFAAYFITLLPHMWC